mmetsp:Transcript_9654/g.28878  ORF Transcript_9654/g.28878 Transcript_9654/m.28878 type:complete len:197 (-) Transcript_9654:33-623(-)
MPSKRKEKVKQRHQEQAEMLYDAHMQQQAEVEPARPDPNTKITWPRHLAGTLDSSRMVMLWPNNLNKLKSIPEGRRIAREHCCDNPIIQEMGEVCQYLKLTHVLEPYKRLPRDATAYPGRIRVLLRDDEGNFASEEATSRKALMRKMGELIPKLQIRARRIEAERREMEYYQKQQQAAIAKAAGGNAKKKGKKGRK